MMQAELMLKLISSLYNLVQIPILGDSCITGTQDLHITERE